MVAIYLFEFLTKQIGINQIGTNQIGTNQIGTNQIGTDQIGTDQIGIEHIIWPNRYHEHKFKTNTHGIKIINSHPSTII